MRYGFGIDVGGTTIKLAFLDEDGNMRDKWEIPTRTEEGGKNVLPDIAASVKEYIAKEGLTNEQIIGIGIGVPGPVSDAGIVINGRVIAGFHGAGGEIGHITMDPTETEACCCGKFGCAEQYCSATGVVRMAKRYLAANDTPSVLREGKFECKDVFAAAAKGDEAANAILEQVYEILGRFLASIACVADPEVIVLGGGVSKAGTPLIDGATKYFHKYAFHACRSTRITLATLGNDAGAYGAFKLALDEFGA